MLPAGKGVQPGRDQAGVTMGDLDLKNDSATKKSLDDILGRGFQIASI